MISTQKERFCWGI